MFFMLAHHWEARLDGEMFRPYQNGNQRKGRRLETRFLGFDKKAEFFWIFRTCL